MARVFGIMISTVALILAGVATGNAAAQDRQTIEPKLGVDALQSSLLELVQIQEVQADLGLSDEERGKVEQIRDEIANEIMVKLTASRKANDLKKQQAILAGMLSGTNQMARERLRAVLSRKQMLRLSQIRIQARPLAENLTNQRLASRLDLTAAQQHEVARIIADTRARRMAMRDDLLQLRSATPEEHEDVYASARKIRDDADARAFELLNAEQRKIIERLQGPKVKLPMRGVPRHEA